jgi:hypothetical protein
MECLVCRQKVKPGEQIFWGNQMECHGPGEYDCSYSEASEGLMGAVHLFCLENSTGVVKTPNMAVPEPVEEESVVQRSDALGILME